MSKNLSGEKQKQNQTPNPLYCRLCAIEKITFSYSSPHFNFSAKFNYFQDLSSTSLRTAGLSVARIVSLKLSSTFTKLSEGAGGAFITEVLSSTL